jgi:hypothetical protein
MGIKPICTLNDVNEDIISNRISNWNGLEDEILSHRQYLIEWISPKTRPIKDIIPIMYFWCQTTENIQESHEEIYPIPLPSNEIIQEKYVGKYIAFSEGVLYAVSDSLKEIHQLAEKRVPHDREYIIRFIQKGVFIYEFYI